MVLISLPHATISHGYGRSECKISNDCNFSCEQKGFLEGGICSEYDKKCICNGKK